GDPLARQLTVLALGDPEQSPQHLQDREVGDRAAVRLRLRFEDLDPAGSAALGELAAEPALAGPGFGDDADHGALAGFGSPQGVLEGLDLLRSADEARKAALPREIEPRASIADPGELVDADRLARPLDLELAEVDQLEEPLGELGGALRQVGLA